MKKFLLLLVLSCFFLLMFGCSESPQITSPTYDVQIPTVNGKPAALVQRPEFIDNRPDDVKANYVLMADIDFFSAEKKPPKPPPDTGSEDPNPNPAHKYAYIVGISDYEGTANDLQYADDDARDMKSYYASQGFTVRMDVDRSGTAQNISDGLDWLIANAQPGDEIVFTYSGHGDKVGQYGSCIISTDLYYVTHGYIMQKFNQATCSKKLATVDACKAGSFLRDGETGSVIATASNNTYSYDAPDLNNGAWTYYFLEGTESLIYAEDIASYAEDGMKAWAKIYHVRVSPSHTDKYTGMFDI